MVRKRRKKALYEVISEGQVSPDRGRAGQQQYQEKADEDASRPETPALWPRRPKILRFGANRLELSVPYQLVVAALLGIILLLLVVFRLGQSWQSVDRLPKKVPEAARQQPLSPVVTEAIKPPAPAGQQPPNLEKVEPAQLKGNNRIVIQTCQIRAPLEPVKQYFAQFGMETEIRKINNWYYLITKNKYENPERAGTDGYLAKQKIIELGAGYKAPQGYDTFGSRPFHDAYGMRFED
jgi:hypothetical protein